jgi:hypothetical protein
MEKNYDEHHSGSTTEICDPGDTFRPHIDESSPAVRYAHNLCHEEYDKYVLQLDANQTPIGYWDFYMSWSATRIADLMADLIAEYGTGNDQS